jgi:hypothetical protein
MNHEKEESVWVVEAKLFTHDAETAEKIIRELESKGFSVQKRNVVIEYV